MNRRGRLNVIDLGALAAVTLAAGWSVSVARLIYEPAPQIEAVEPSSVELSRGTWLTITGRHLRNARVIMVTDRTLDQIAEATDTRLRVLFDPKGVGLLQGQYDIRALNGWGRGAGLLKNGIAVTAEQIEPAREIPVEKPVEKRRSPREALWRNRAWVILEGWLFLPRRLARSRHLIEQRGEDYEADGQLTGKVLGLTLMPEPVRVYRMASGYRVVVYPAEELSRQKVTLQVLSVRDGDQYRDQDTLLQTSSIIPFSNWSWRGDIQMIGPPRLLPGAQQTESPALERLLEMGGDAEGDDADGESAREEGVNAIEVDLQLRLQSRQYLDRMPPGHPFVNWNGDAAGTIVQRALWADSSLLVVRVRLVVEARDGALWVPSTLERKPVKLQRGTPLVFQAWVDRLEGKVLNRIEVDQAP
jgi:hypothetical protein